MLLWNMLIKDFWDQFFFIPKARNIYYYYLEFFTSVLADGFSLEFEWLQDSQDSGCSQQCCHLDSLHPSANFQVYQAF